MTASTSSHSDASTVRPWGDRTNSVVSAIQQGHNTLHSIATATGLDYRTTNAIVASLETQVRVKARNPTDRRKNRVFDVVHAQRWAPEDRHQRKGPVPPRSVPDWASRLHPSDLAAGDLSLNFHLLRTFMAPPRAQGTAAHP